MKKLIMAVVMSFVLVISVFALFACKKDNGVYQDSFSKDNINTIAYQTVTAFEEMNAIQTSSMKASLADNSSDTEAAKAIEMLKKSDTLLSSDLQLTQKDSDREGYKFCYEMNILGQKYEMYIQSTYTKQDNDDDEKEIKVTYKGIAIRNIVTSGQEDKHIEIPFKVTKKMEVSQDEKENKIEFKFFYDKNDQSENSKSYIEIESSNEVENEDGNQE